MEISAQSYFLKMYEKAHNYFHKSIIEFPKHTINKITFLYASRVCTRWTAKA